MRSNATSAMRRPLAPPEFKAVHPLGKSPVITDGDLTIAESGAIVDYVVRRYGKGMMIPALGSPDYETSTSGCITRKARRCCR